VSEVPSVPNPKVKELSQRPEHPVEYSPKQSSDMMGERRDGLAVDGIEQSNWSTAVMRRNDSETAVLFSVSEGTGKEGSVAVRAKLATVALPGGSSGGSSGPAVLHDLLHPPDGMMPVQLPDGRRVFAPEACDPETVRQHVLDREAARR
jgi:hypothetical protein